MSKKLFSKVFILLLVVGLLFAVAPTKQAQAATLDVCPSCTYTTINAALTAAVAGDTINVAAGTYVEDVVVNKAITLQGAGMGTTTIVATTGNTSPLTFNTSGATVSGFHITHNYTQAELDAWNFNNNGVTFYQNTTGNTLANCKVTKSRNGIYINNARGNILNGNTIENNRTGINLTNYVDNTQITNNIIQKNWTIGIVYYQGSAGLPTNFSTVTVTGNTFSNNWYSEILLKDNGSVVSADTGVLNVTNNTFGDSPVTYSTSADPSLNEPNFAGLKPVEFGGTATMPTTPLPTLRIYNVPGVTLQKDGKTLVVGAAPNFTTIQAAIDAAAAGDTILVYPGAYDETASGRTLDSGGTYQFGLFFDSAKPGITLQGVMADGSVITDAANVAASIKTNATNSFGTSGVFVEADDITITGLRFLDNYESGAISNNKTLEVIGNNFTFKDNVIAVSEWGSLYLNDWSYNSSTGLSRVESYNISENLFKFGASVDISSGVGVSGPASGRVIASNTFTADGVTVTWASISFNGTIPSVGWFVDPVGGATITGNSFTGVKMPIRSRGIVEDDFAWADYLTLNTFEKAVIAWDIVNDEPRAYTYTSGSYTLNNVILIGTVIQDEIGHAQAGDEVRVIKGTFVEDVTVDKDITLKGIPDPFAVTPTVVVDGLITITADGATVTNLKVSPGAVVGQVAAISVYARNTTVSGNLIDGLAGNGTASVKGIFVYGGSSTALTNIIIDGNTVKNISNTGKGTDGIQIQGVLDGVSVTDNTIQAISSAGWAFGIEVTPTGSFPTTPPQNVTITGNTVDGVTATTYPGVTLGIDVAGSSPADAGEVEVHQNVFTNYQVAAVNKDPLHQLDATLNYWGTACGPAAGTIYGDVLVYPWNIDAIGTPMATTAQTHNFTPGTGTAAINAAIACAPSYSTFNFAAGAYTAGFVVPGLGQDHQTLVLADNAVITASSPCFDVSADFTTIKAEHIGMASCVTVAGSNGIDVAAGLRNLTVDGLEIYGPGNDGIHFAGVIRDVVLKDNYIHNLAGNGVYFGAQPEWIAAPEGIDIHGNLFKENALFGVTNPNGTAAIDATYNSWGNVAGPSAGDGVGPNVTATPFTHVDVYMVASGTPWTGIPLNQVVSGQTITFKVMAHVVNALTVDVKLVYPTNLTGAVTSAATSSFPSFAIFDTDTANVIGFYGMAPYVVGSTPETTGYLPVTGDVELFTVTFTGGTAGLDLPMNLDELSDVFGMEGVGSSSNIYAVALLDSTVNVIALPVIDIVPVPGQTYIAGMPINFNVVITNLNGANYADIGLEFETSASGYVEFLDTDNVWKPYPGVISWGALATNGTDLTPVLPLFRVTFFDPGVNTINLTMLDRPTVDDIWLDDTFEDFTLLGDFTVTGTFSMQGRSTRAGIPVTLDYQDLVAYTDKTGTTINQISYNLVIPEVNGGHWLLTTLQPRYLNVQVANNKIVSVNSDETLIALQLKGGNAVWALVDHDGNPSTPEVDIINLQDASKVGDFYGIGTIADDADVNFDGKVNIQDLALVGGNFDLTSELAYGVGNLQTWLVQ